MTTRSRSELKRQYREAGTPMGIYAVRNTRNGKVLIGGTMNLPGALNRASFSLRLGGHSNRELQREWKEMGADAFTFEVLDELERSSPDPSHDYRDDLAALERCGWRSCAPRRRRLPPPAGCVMPDPADPWLLSCHSEARPCRIRPVADDRRAVRI